MARSPLAPQAATALVGLSALAWIACQPRKMETYTPPPEQPMPSAAPSAAPPPVATPPAVPQLGPALTPTGLVFPPEWNMPPMPVPAGMPLPQGIPSMFPFPFPGAPPGPAPTAAPTATPTPTTTTSPTITPPPPPIGSFPAPWAKLEADVLTLVNQARAKGAVCGSTSYGPAGPLAPHGALQGSARAHSKDMADRNYFNHTSPEGRDPIDRMKAAGWVDAPGSMTGENIAAGYVGANAVVEGWLKSPGHCSNIMNPKFQHLGVGYYESPTAKFKQYWTQNFGGN